MREDQTVDTITWSRRWMRRSGSLVERNDFVPQAWHIQNPAPGSSGTYCGVNVRRFYGDVVQAAPPPSLPDGKVCAKCLRQYAAGRVLPLGGGSSHRKG